MKKNLFTKCLLKIKNISEQYSGGSVPVPKGSYSLFP